MAGVQGRPKSDVVWDAGKLTREQRGSALGVRGAVTWITGLPAAGKSTLASAVEDRLVTARRRMAYRLDGDNLRHGLCSDLGFSDEDRTENVRRVGEVARLMADAGAIVLVSLVSPYRAGRDAAREACAAWDVPFVEVWVDTPLDACEERDPKGLYAKARAGELKGMTGVDDPYEPPLSPELVIDGRAPLDRSVDAVLALLDERCAVPAPA